jgi:hypothetical protein
MGIGGARVKYKLADKQEALGLFLQGISYGKIVEEMNNRYKFDPSMDVTTVKRWSKAMGWNDMRVDMEHDLTEETKEFAKVKVRDRMTEIEEVRQEFLDKMRDGAGNTRTFEFAKLTQMLDKMQVREDEKQELVEFINVCIRRALQVVDMDEGQQRAFLEKYIELLRAGLG